jgi:acetyl-CoA carboxylase beta subunit
MPATVIVECQKCKGLLLTGVDQKTRCCPYCSTKIDLKKTKRLAWANSAAEASEMLRQLKAKRQDNNHKIRH